MVLMLGVFLFNLLCGLVPCDQNLGTPEISSVPRRPEIGFRDGRSLNKAEIEAKVTVQSGKIEGYHMKTIRGRTIFGFEGIKYGTAGRWKSPVPVSDWKGTLQAKKPGPDCLQLSAAKYIRVHGNEDCLFLNVFTPELPFKGNSPKFPTIIYFHPGSFLMGSGSEHGPTYLLDEDVILVTVNFRLGVLGFLSTGDTVIPGNYGLKDQQLSMQWVHDNIDQFGGDPNNVNIWGYSAGGVSAHLHMISTKTRHLFSKALSLGAGSAFQHWAVQKPYRARNYTNRVGRRFGCPTDDSYALADCLMNISAIRLVADQLNLFDWFPFPATIFSPTIEPEHPEAFLTQSPEDAYKHGQVAKKPWVISTTSEEGLTGVLVLQLFMRWFPFKLSWNIAAPNYLDYRYIAQDPGLITEKVTKFYLGDKEPMRGTSFEYAEMMTDRYFHFGFLKGVQAHSEIAPTYSYYFSFNKGKYSMGNYYGYQTHEWGPGHVTDDYYYMNCTSQYAGFKETDPDYKMARVMINFLVNFVTTGTPMYVNDEGEEFKVWKPVTNISDVRMLQMDQEVKMISFPQANLRRLKFWQDLRLRDTIPWIPIK